MNKEEILEKSRVENKNQDVYEKEVISKGMNYGAIAAGVVATAFFILQIFLGKGMNYGLYAVVFSIPAAEFCYKAKCLKRKHEITVAVLYVFCVVAFSAAYILQITDSPLMQ